jgi:molybdenum cofactor cytidylyltransferase
MKAGSQDINCVVMASGLSARYGKNKLLEDLCGRAVITRTVDSLKSAGFAPLVVTRGPDVAALMQREGVACVRHGDPLKSDTIHVGINALPPDAAGWLFMPADQPLVLPDSLRRLAARFLEDPARAVRLGYEDTPGSPVLFPAACREALLAYRGDRGGADVLREHCIPCDLIQAEYPWELWDVDNPEAMERARNAFHAHRNR